MDSFRVYTIRLALMSIDIAAKQANETVCVHISYNKSGGYGFTQLDVLGNLIVKAYQQKTSMTQFQHIKFIVDNNDFADDDWVMFHDDDDISLPDRITLFRKNCNDCDVFGTKMVHTPIHELQIKNSHLQPSFDFGPMFSKIKVLREFFSFKSYDIEMSSQLVDFTLSNHGCDCIFRAWVTRSEFVEKKVDDVMYIAFPRDCKNMYFTKPYHEIYHIVKRFLLMSR